MTVLTWVVRVWLLLTGALILGAVAVNAVQVLWERRDRLRADAMARHPSGRARAQ